MLRNLTSRPFSICFLLLACTVATSGARAADAADLAVADLAGYVFVANRTSPEVAVIDIDSDVVVRRVVLGGIPHQFVISDELGKLAATHLEERTVSIADLSRGGFNVLQVGLAPEQLQIDPEGRLLAISSSQDGRILLVSLASGEIVRDIAWPQQPGDLIFDRNGDTLFVGSRNEGRIAVVDVDSGTMRDEIALRTRAGVLPGVVELVGTPGGQFGFALHGQSGQVSAIDLRSLEILEVSDLPGPAVQAYPTANAQHVLVPNSRDQSVSMISTWTFRESARLPGGADVSGINAGMFDTVAFVLDRAGENALILDLLSREQIGEIALHSRPETAITAAAGTKLYVALSETHKVAVIDMRQSRVLTLIEGVGANPWGVSSAGGLSYCH